MKPTLSQTLGAMLIAFAAACDPPPAPPKAPKQEAKAPPPKCESFTEKCVAKRSTRARLPKLDYTLAPPSGWLYAQEADATVAEKSPSGAVIAAASFDPPKATWELKKVRIDAIEHLGKRLGVHLAQKNIVDVHLRDVDDKLEVAGRKLAIWEQEGATRGSVHGNVVVVVGTIDKRELVMVAFAPKGDDTDSSALVESLKSLSKAENADDEEAGDADASKTKAKRP